LYKTPSFLISNGLREFWDKATVLMLAAWACCKQYCLRRTKDDELYCAGKLKNRSPKIICSLEFSLVTFFVLRQRKQHGFGQAKEPTRQLAGCSPTSSRKVGLCRAKSEAFFDHHSLS
jgi:hypothetical protein